LCSPARSFRSSSSFPTKAANSFSGRWRIRIAHGKIRPGNSVIFAILVTGTIIIVASLSSLLYHWGILQKVVQAAAWVMRKIMRTSGSETLSACANIFMGQTEAPLMIRPYVRA